MKLSIKNYLKLYYNSLFYQAVDDSRYDSTIDKMDEIYRTFTTKEIDYIDKIINSGD